MNLASAFATAALARPSKTAVYWGEQELSYSRLLVWSQTVVTAQLRGPLGLIPGDRVGLLLRNCPEFIAGLMASFDAGVVAVPINHFLKADEIAHMVADAGIALLITDAELRAQLPSLPVLCPQLQWFNVEDFPQTPADGAPRPAPSTSEGDLAMLIYTSGTTGRPKGAMLTHGNLLHNVESCRIVLETIDHDRFAVILPMFHSYMITVGILLPLIVGGSLVLVKSLQNQRQVLQELCHRQATILPAIPQFYRALAHASAPASLPFRLCISGAAPLPLQVLQDFEAKYRIPLIEGYGLSEASPVVTKNPIRAVRKPGSVGLPVTNVEVSVQDESGRVLPDGQVGEICVRGGNVMLGYWKNPAETAAVMRDGWLLTGDLGYRDVDGYFFITDRKKDLLLVNGINVYPREIEEVLNQFPGVKEAAVVGVPDLRKGERPLGFVAAAEGAALDEARLMQYVRQKLADYKVPRRIILLPALPRNATGKILKNTLRQLAREVPVV